MKLKEDSERFDLPWVLLCEGRGDQRFFGRLIEAHGIDDQFDIRVPIIEGEYRGGRTNFGRCLSSSAVDETFIQNVKAVLVVSDNDNDEAFGEVQAQLRAAGGFGVLDNPCEVAQAKGYADIVVLMLPMEQTGNLECLCLEPAYAKWGLKDQLDEFVGKCPAGKWKSGKQAKMRIQTILAATNDSQPDTGFAGHWDQPAKYRVPLDHECFVGLVAFLKEFPVLIGA